MCIRQKVHKSCTTKGLWVHFSKERRGGRKVNFFYAVPSVMLQLESLGKDHTDLLPNKVLELIFIGFGQLDGPAILSGNNP